MTQPLRRLAAIAFSLALAPAFAAEVTVMSGGAVKTAFTAAAGAWERPRATR